MNFNELNIGLDGHVSDDNQLQQYLEYIKDCIDQGAFETASMYADNMQKALFTRHEFESMKRGV